MGNAACPRLAEILTAPGPPLPWITTGVQIQWNTLNFEAKGWQTFVCSTIDPCQNETNLSIPRAVLVALIMAGYPINVCAVMSVNMSLVPRQGKISYPYPNTITEYLTDAGVEPRDFDTKVRVKKPFSRYSLMDSGNPKKKGQPSITVGQSDEPTGVAAKTVYMTSTSLDPSDSAAGMPPPLSLGPSASVPSTSVLKPVPMPAHLLSAMRVSQTLASLPNTGESQQLDVDSHYKAD